MKLTVISDTHGKHRLVKSLPKSDVLIHCGDFSNVGEKHQITDFIEWFYEQPHKHKIFVAGNHDRTFDPKYHKSPVDSLWLSHTLSYIKELGIHYLENNDVVIDGVKFWGSPITPNFAEHYWAFNKARGEEIRRYWENIPQYVDIVITHGPPAYQLDWCVNGNIAGCHDLAYYIQQIRPRYHFFGHIHESYGVTALPDTTFGNASLLNESYFLVNKPLEFEI
jgi:Icc-related predicted phosphoesterase